MANTYNFQYSLKPGENGIVNLKSKGSINWLSPVLFFLFVGLLLTFIVFIPMGYGFVSWLKTMAILLGVFAIILIFAMRWFLNISAKHYVFDTEHRTVWENTKGQTVSKKHNTVAPSPVAIHKYASTLWLNGGV